MTPPAYAEAGPQFRVLDFVREARWVTSERVIRWGIGFAVLTLVVLAGGAVLNWTADVTLRYMASDFANYWAGARMAAAGDASGAYDLVRFNAFEKSLFGPAFSDNIYGYPPVHLLVTLPFAALGLVPAFILWNLLGAALCAAALSRLVGWRVAALAVAAAPGSALTMMGGNTGQFTAGLLGGGLALLDRSPVFAGVLLGFAGTKPQLGVLVPFALLAGGRWRTFAAAAATLGGLVALSLALLGPQSWTGFLREISFLQAMMEVPGVFWARSQSVFISAINFGSGVRIAWAAQTLSAALAIGLTILVWRGRASLAAKSATLVVAAFLATTYARDYDTVVLVFAAAWLAGAGHRTGFLPWERITVLLLLVEPVLTDTLTALSGLQFGPLALALALAVLVRRALVEAGAAAQPAPGPGGTT